MSSEYRKLYRSRKQRMIAGVCGGLGDYFGIDPTLVRVLFVIAGLFSVGMAFIAYLILMIVVPEEPKTQPEAPIVAATAQGPDDSVQS